MDFKIHTDTSDSGTKRRPPNYGSLGVKLRLAMLVALLGMTALAMNEAGKPETWERLGFSSPPATSQSAATPDRNRTSPDAQSISRDRGADRDGQAFWEAQFRSRNVDERELLLKLVEDRINGTAWAGDSVPANSLLKRIRQDLDRDTNRTVLRENEATSVRVLLDDLEFWLAGNRPDEGTDRRQSDDHQPIKTRFETLLGQLDALAYDPIEDRSALGRSVERLAWLRSWKRLSNSMNTDPQPVTLVQLTGQPDIYRGQLVSIDGRVKGTERLRVADRELAFEHYHALWIKPREMTRTPYCVYVRSLPDGFPGSDGNFRIIDEPVSVTGIFFKLRSYVTTEESIEICPLLVADSVIWQPAITQSAAATWQPPGWILMICFLAIPMLAAWLALGVYRRTRVIPLQPGQQELEQIAKNLKVISDDDSIKSDRQRVDELQQQINFDPE